MAGYLPDERASELSRRGLLKGAGSVGLAALATGGLSLAGLVAGATAAEAAPDPRLLTLYPRINRRALWAGTTCPATGPLPWEKPGDVKFLLVHHTQSPGNTYTAANVPAMIRSMYRYHTGPAKQWNDLAYNFLIDKYGGVWEGRTGSLTKPVIPSATGGTQGFDQLGCFIGDHTAVYPTAQAQASMISMLAWLARKYQVNTTPGTTVSFVSRGSNRLPAGTTATARTIDAHRHMSQTDCPGNAAYSLVCHVFPGEVTKLNATL